MTALDMRGLKASITHEGGALVMVVEDEDSGVHLEAGASDSVAQAILGAELLADVAHQYAALLRDLAASRAPQPAT